jgi:hypothetical protein
MDDFTAKQMRAYKEENERLRAACDLTRKMMSTQSNGGSGWMADFEALAYPDGKETPEMMTALINADGKIKIHRLIEHALEDGGESAVQFIMMHHMQRREDGTEYMHYGSATRDICVMMQGLLNAVAHKSQESVSELYVENVRLESARETELQDLAKTGGVRCWLQGTNPDDDKYVMTIYGPLSPEQKRELTAIALALDKTPVYVEEEPENGI